MRNDKLEQLIISVPKNKELEKYSFEEIRLAMHFQAIYSLPTQELIQFLKYITNYGKSIEIGAGSGIIGKALGITCTDSYMQQLEDVKLMYALTKQPTVNYGSHVKKMDAEKAVEKYKPDVIISSWITPKFDKDDNWLNMHGMIEERLLKKCYFYAQVCGEVHYNKPIMQLPHVRIHADWIRGRSKDDNYICIYTKNFMELSKLLESIKMDFTATFENSNSKIAI